MKTLPKPNKKTLFHVIKFLYYTIRKTALYIIAAFAMIGILLTELILENDTVSLTSITKALQMKPAILVSPLCILMVSLIIMDLMFHISHSP